MSSDNATVSPTNLSATPGDEDLRAWDALPRDEQLNRLRAHFLHADCVTVSKDKMDDILAEARRLADARRV